MHVRQSPASQRDPSPAASGTGRSHQTIKKDPEGVLSPLIIISDESSNDELDRISKLQFSFVETTENAIKKESEDVSPPSSSSSDTAPMDPDQNNRGADDERWRGVHSQSTESGNAQRGAPGRRSSTEVRSPSTSVTGEDVAMHSPNAFRQSHTLFAPGNPPGQRRSLDAVYPQPYPSGYHPPPHPGAPYAQFPPPTGQFDAGLTTQPFWIPPVDYRNLSPEQQQILMNAHQQVLLVGAHQQQQPHPSVVSSTYPSPYLFEGGTYPPPPPALGYPLTPFPVMYRSPNPSQPYQTNYDPRYVVQSQSLEDVNSRRRSNSSASSSMPSPISTSRSPRAAGRGTGGGAVSSGPVSPAVRSGSQSTTRGNRLPSSSPGAGPSTRREPAIAEVPPTATSDGAGGGAGSDPDPEEAALSEDKRRRNTAASARFRIKKKQRVLNLERSIADLEGRAEDLEKEAVELRRENGWLKEMVILKGRRALGLMPERQDRRGSGREEEEGGDGGDEAEAEDAEPRSRRASPSHSPDPKHSSGSGGSAKHKGDRGKPGQ